MHKGRSLFKVSYLWVTYVLATNKTAYHFCTINLGCVTPLGMENKAIHDTQIDASSQLDSTHSAKQARLHSEADGSTLGSWSARTNDLNQWLQVDLSTYNRVTRVATQGRNGLHQWVTKYKLQYSDDGDTFHVYEEPGNGGAKVCPYYGLRIFITTENNSRGTHKNDYRYVVSLRCILK